MNPYEYIDANCQDFVEELKALLRIPSISTLSEHAGDIRRAAEWLRAHLKTIGMTRVEIFETPGYPIVYAEWLQAGDDSPTVLIYGHYDVQPADDAGNMWQSDPFEPVVRGGNLFARGATDDKGQVFTQIKAVQSLLETGSLNVNIKFIIEGEEEIGSSSIYPFIDEHADLLSADVVVVSDTSIQSLDQPSIVYGLRGITFLEIEVQGPAHDLHSGMYGGLVHNPAQALVEILAQMHDAEGHITVPGFYDRVVALDEAERAELTKTPFTLERLKRETGVSAPWGEPGYKPHERIGVRPTLEINGLVSGWTGEGGKTVLPAKALAKISCRLVPEQDPVEIDRLITDYVNTITPDTVTAEVRPMNRGGWAVMNLNSAYMQAAVRAYEFGFGARPIFMREGGSIPVVVSFQDVLKAPVIMLGFGLPDDNLHGPNEKYSLECFERGMKTAVKFCQEIASL
ncbi:MAG: dipeptidase [Anaerolineae bacterium]|nr:dipeptidase [Anaerolineae bacterium]